MIELLQHRQIGTGTDTQEKMVADVCVKNNTLCLEAVLRVADIIDFPRDGLFLTTRPDKNHFLPKTDPHHRQHHQRERSAPSRHMYHGPVIALVPAPQAPPAPWIAQQYPPQQYWQWDQQRHAIGWTHGYWPGSR